jgi:malonate transporter and related proteins
MLPGWGLLRHTPYNMRVLQSIFDTVLPFFALIFCGYGAGRLGILNEASAAGVNAFVFFFALPAFLFDLMSTSSLTETFDGSFIAAYLVSGLVVFAVALLLGRLLFDVKLGEASVLGAAAVLGNTGYMGIPLLSAALGREAAIPVVLGLTIEAVIFIPLTMIIIEVGKGLGTGLTRLLSSVGGSLARNPILLSIAAGVLISAMELAVPTPIANFASLLGSAAGPCALFALGATLAQRRVSSGLGEVAYMTFFKLFVHPAVVFLATTVVFDVDPLWATAATLAAALPIAANVFIVARQYDTYVQRASSAILISTAVSVATVSVLLIVLGPG